MRLEHWGREPRPLVVWPGHCELNGKAYPSVTPFDEGHLSLHSKLDSWGGPGSDVGLFIFGENICSIVFIYVSGPLGILFRQYQV